MCYLCREPVNDYRHFFGQGAQPTAEAKCPLWSDNKTLMESEVAQGAIEAKTVMDQEKPDIVLKHDPTKGLRLPDPAFVAAATAAAAPGLEGILGNDPDRIIREQQVRVHPNYLDPNWLRLHREALRAMHAANFMPDAR
jgi:hypothetical protein